MPSPPAGPAVAFRTAHGAAVHNVVTPPVPRIYLRLRFIDPQGLIRDFPPHFPLRVRFGDGAAAVFITPTVQPGGYVSFDARTANPWQTFTLEFRAGDVPYIVCEAPGAAMMSPPQFQLAAGLAAAATHGRRFFSLPRQWELGQADWSPPVFGASGRFDSPPGHFSHTLAAPADISIGTRSAPIDLILRPHWHFSRFEYYDRYWGNAWLDSPPRPAHMQRISLPPITLEGLRNDPNAAGTPDTRSNWAVDLGAHSYVQALPFILRRDATGAALSPPDGAHLGLRLRSDANTFVYARDDQVRLMAVSPPPASPGPDRLRYYDVPHVWKSTKYYVRRELSNPAAAGKFFDTNTAAEIADAENIGKPLVFCLDDMVLSVGTPATGAVTGPLPSPPTRVAIFSHRFDDQLPDTEFHGLYKMLAPVSPPVDLPASDVPVTDNYLFDYADWTRLVVAQGNLFDVFDKRTPDVAGRVVGARAAVRWVDVSAPLPGVDAYTSSPPGTAFKFPDRKPLPNRLLWSTTSGAWAVTARINVPSAHPLFALQPFYQQRQAERYSKPFHATGDDEQIGRFDLALLRCCDVYEGDEVAANLHYIRSYFNFDYSPPSSPPGKVKSALTAAQRPPWANLISMNVGKRWSGNDPGISESRALFRPHGAPGTHLRIPVVWFPQSVEQAHAHFEINLLGIPPGGSGRDNRNGFWGRGESSDGSFQSLGAARHFRYAAAHESGHMDGLPDEYNERWDGASYNQISFKANLPGDPFERDGRTEAGVQSPPGDTAMMNGNCRLRNRFFWHAAEWCRLVTGTPFEVDLTDIGGTRYPNYWLPAHPNTAKGRTYYDWPFEAWVSPPGGHRFDWFLYRLGREHYTSNPAMMPHASVAQPFDGVLVIGMHMVCQLQGNANLQNEDDLRSRLLAVLAASVGQEMNNRFYAGGTHGGQTFNRCLIHFTPQFFVQNHPFASPPRAPVTVGGWTYREVDRALYTGATSLATLFGASCRLEVWNAAATVSPPNWSPPLRRLSMTVASDADLDVQFEGWFPRFLGLAGEMHSVTAAQMQTIVQGVIPAFTVHTLP